MNGTKKKILDSALQVFSRRGFLGATTREIAREAGIAEITLFRHFPTKEKLFQEVVKTNSFLPALREFMPEALKLPYEEGLRIIGKRYLESLASRMDLIRIMHLEVRRYPEEIRGIYHSIVNELHSTLASYFWEMQQAGMLRDFNPELGARAFLGLLFSHFNAQEFLMGSEYKKWGTDLVIEEFVSIFVRGTLKQDQKTKTKTSRSKENKMPI